MTLQDTNRTALIQHYLEKSEDRVDAAAVNLGASFPDVAVSNAYYSVFSLCERAVFVLWTDPEAQKRTSKRHGSLQ